MKRNQIIYLITILMVVLNSCKQPNAREKYIKESLNKEINLEMIRFVIKHGSERVLFKDFRNKFKYLYLVYLQNGCSPCYSKYIEWQQKMGQLNKSDECTILFIINGRSYESFVSDLLKHNNTLNFSFEDRYYTYMDETNQFIRNNVKIIPQWIIESSILIDQNNNIRLIGNPFITQDMTNLFSKISMQNK